MKKTMVMGSLLMLALLLTVPGIYAQQQASQPPRQGGWGCPWMQGYQGGQGGWYCPWCGAGMGPGMMHHRGYGMMQRGQGQGAQQAAPGQTPGKPLSEDQARLLLENYLKNTNNPNLKLGGISSKDGFYEAQIVTQDGSMVDKIQVDKNTGWFRSAY